MRRSAELGRQPLGVAGRRARAVAELGRAGQAEPRGELGEGLAQPGDRLSAILHEPDALAGKLAVPGVERGRARRPAADARDQGVALRKRA